MFALKKLTVNCDLMRHQGGVGECSWEESNERSAKKKPQRLFLHQVTITSNKVFVVVSPPPPNEKLFLANSKRNSQGLDLRLVPPSF